MRRITNKEILDFLKEEGVLYKVLKEENNEGNLVIEGIELNTIFGIKYDLEEKRRQLNDTIKLLKVKIKSNEDGVYFEKLDEVILRDKSIIFEKGCYFLDCSHLVITNCLISAHKKDLESESMITIVEKIHEKNKDHRNR
jgi:hypothetical protein